MDRGSIRGYAKDVKERHRKRAEKRAERKRGRPNESKKEVLASLSESKESPSQLVYSQDDEIVPSLSLEPEKQSRFPPSSVSDWGWEEVSAFLRGLGLGQYEDTFRENEMTSGPLLLEIGLYDLDYLGIKPLGHRKVLLKGLEDLRRKKPLSSSLSSPSFPARNEQPSSEPEQVHWSTLPPLSSQPVSHQSNGEEEEDGVYDEQLQASLFQQAVMAWRQSVGVEEERGQERQASNQSRSFFSSMGGDTFSLGQDNQGMQTEVQEEEKGGYKEKAVDVLRETMESAFQERRTEMEREIQEAKEELRRLQEEEEEEDFDVIEIDTNQKEEEEEEEEEEEGYMEMDSLDAQTSSFPCSELRVEVLSTSLSENGGDSGDESYYVVEEDG